tara:strand:+ start:2748 stop:3203 length:456 start_codon:yes stop_codon:yes gene_type:complete
MLTSYKKLKNSKEFKGWKEKHKDSFLCSFIIMNEKIQFDFYNKNDTITSFKVDEKITIDEDQKIFKKNKLQQLKLEQIDLTKEQALEIVKEKYPKEEFTRQIIILQNTEKPFWNLTLITSSMKLLNIKIDMKKNILSETFEPLTKFMKQAK